MLRVCPLRMDGAWMGLMPVRTDWTGRSLCALGRRGTARVPAHMALWEGQPSVLTGVAAGVRAWAFPHTLTPSSLRAFTPTHPHTYPPSHPLSTMELRHLRYFSALARELHFRRAAESVFVAQSTLSQQIQALEDELGVQLVERSRQHVALTEIGKTFVPYARRVLQEARRAASIARAARDGQAGLLRLTYEATAMRSGLPEVIQAFREAVPDVKLDLTELDTHAQVQALREDEADAGFLFLPIDERHLRVRVLQTAPMIAVLPDTHSLADRDRVCLQELRDEPHVMWARDAAPRIFDAYVRACHDTGFSPQIVQEVQGGESFLGLVEAGLGVSIAHVSNTHIQRPGVRYALITEPEVPLTLGLAVRPDEASPVLQHLLDAIDRTHAFAA